ncbi:hypothetical protein AB4Z35_19235 [Pseudomonas sp. KB_15]|uniref:hypothetical protein n=1 Tax=Pseudomonas sp. KB_15 TaxID=3233035 RepID=UPI003F96B668
MAILLKYKYLVLLVAIIAGAFLWWASRQEEIISKSASHDRAISILVAEQIIETGKAPEDWPTTIFIPAKAIEKLANALIGAEYTIPDAVDSTTNKPKGNFKLVVDKFDLKVSDGALSPTIQVTASYIPNGNPPAWADSVVRFDIVGILQPSKRTTPSDKANEQLTKVFRIVPLYISPKVNVWPLTLKASGLVAQIAAAQVIEKMNDNLYIDVPTISSALEINTNINSEQYTKFEVEGGYTLRQSMGGELQKKLLNADNVLISTTGIWFLGGLNLAEIPNLPLDDAGLSNWLETHSSVIKEKMNPYEVQTDNIKAKISNNAIVEMLDELKKPRLVPGLRFVGDFPFIAFGQVPAKSKYEMNLHAYNATGVISNQSIMKDNLLGDVGVKITPRTSDLAKGIALIDIPVLDWKPSIGIEGKLVTKVDVNADIHAHLSTGNIGGGVGLDIAVAGTTEAAIPVQLKLEAVSTAVGSAFVMRTILECTPVDVDTIPDASYKGIDFDIVKVATVKFRFKKVIGGENSAPSILLDSTPQYISALKPNEKENQPGFAEKGFLLTLSPKTISVTPGGLELESGIDISPTDKKPEDNVEAKKALHDAISKSIKGKDCENPNDVEVLLGPPTLSDKGILMSYIMFAAKEGQHIADETKKEAEKFYNRPFDSVKALPDNVIREGKTAVNNIIDEAGRTKEKIEQVFRDLCGDFC